MARSPAQNLALSRHPSMPVSPLLPGVRPGGASRKMGTGREFSGCKKVPCLRMRAGLDDFPERIKLP